MKCQLLVPACACALYALGPPAQAQSVTGAPVDLTPGSISGDVNPRLSQDATKIVYVAQKGQWDASYTYDNTIVMNLDGSSKTMLEVRAYFGGSENASSISADGLTVALQQSGRTAEFLNQNGLYKVAVNPFLATQLNQAVDHPDDTGPVFSQDGTKYVFLSKRALSGTYQVFYMKPVVEDATTNIPVQLTNWSDGEAASVFGTADGKLLILKKLSNIQQEIFRCDIADSNADGVADNLTQITNLGRFITSISQPVAGGKIYFATAANDGKSHVFTVNNDGTGLHQVTGGTFDEASPYAASNRLVASINDPKNGVNNYDVMIYTLNTAAGTGTVTGKLTSSAGAPLAGASVAAYDGDTGTGDATTDASGNYTLTLPAGGYTLVFATNTPSVYEIKRSVAVSVGGTITEDAFTTPTASPRPRGTIATIKSGKVEVKWAAAGTPDGYNVYRATSETGTWTKVTATLVSPADPVKFIDNTPGNLGSVFYKVTGVTGGVESAFSEIAQAANNLLWNPSFEQVDGAGEPIGWTYGSWGGDGTHGTSTSVKVDGTRSLFLKTGATARGGGMYHLDLPFYPPTQPGVAMVEGMWGKFTDTNTTWPLALMQSPWVAGYGDIPWWYPQDGVQGPGLSQWDTNGLYAGGGDTPWTWLYNTNNVIEWEFTQGTRFSILWPNDGYATLGVATAYADDATLQVKRYTTTGWVMGRIVDLNGTLLSGVTVSCGGQSIITSGAQTFVIKDVPTGNQALTIQVPGKPDYVTTIGNFGGYRVPDYVLGEVIPFTVSGYVKYPDGKPCPGADVRLEFDDASKKFTAITDTSGYYKFTGTTANPINYAGNSHLVAHKAGYLSTSLEKSLGASGWAINDLQLRQPSMVVQIAKVTGAAPVVDGNVNLATEYAGAQEVNFPFFDSVASFAREKAYMKWDASNLYIAFVANEPNPTGMLAASTGLDNQLLWWTGSSWNADDVVAAWIDPTNADRSGLGHEQWQVLSNSNTTAPSYADIAWRRGGDQYATPPLEGLWGLDNNITGFTFASKVDSVNHKWYTEWMIPLNGLAVTVTGSNTLGGMSEPVVNAGTEWAMDLAHHRHQPLPDGQGFDTGWFIAHFVNTVTPYLKGDINGDGVIDVLDAKLALAIAAGLEPAADRMQGNINADTVINLTDAAAIIQKANGKNPF